MIVDGETKRELSDSEQVRLMTETPGWSLVKARLDAEIVDLQMIGNVTGVTPQDKVMNMEARAMAVKILFDWLKRDVYGRIQQAENAQQALADTDAVSFIARE